MSKSSNSVLPIIAGSLAFAGAVAAASLWSNFRHQESSSNDSDKNDALTKSIGDFNLVPKLAPTDSEKLKEVVNASLEYFYHDLPAHIIGDVKMVQTRTPTDREDFIHQIINGLFKNFYMVKGDQSVSTENTEDSSVSSSESLEAMEVEEKSTNYVEEKSINYAEEKSINYDWDDEEYIEEKEVEETPVSGSDAAALLLATALIVAQAMV